MTITILAIGFICFIFGFIIGFGVYKYQTERWQRQPMEWYPSSFFQDHVTEKIP